MSCLTNVVPYCHMARHTVSSWWGIKPEFLPPFRSILTRESSPGGMEGLTAFFDSHVSVWMYSARRQGKQSGLHWTKTYPVTDAVCVLNVIIPSSEVSKWQLAADSRCFGKVRWTEMLFCVFVLCLCLLVFLSSGVSNYRPAGFCKSGEGCWWRGDLLTTEGYKRLR